MREAAIGPELPSALGVHLLELLRGTDHSQPPRAVDDLRLLLRAPVVGLVVYGTASQGGPGVASDLDLLIVTGDALRGGLWGRSGELEVDAYVEPWTALSKAPPTEWSHVAGGEVLFDHTGGALRRWLSDLDAWRRRPVDPWTEVDRLRDRQWAFRVVGRVARQWRSDTAVAGCTRRTTGGVPHAPCGGPRGAPDLPDPVAAADQWPRNPPSPKPWKRISRGGLRGLIRSGSRPC